MRLMKVISEILEDDDLITDHFFNIQYNKHVKANLDNQLEMLRQDNA